VNRTAWLGIAGAALVVGAACHDSVGVGACFEPNVSGYQYSLASDTGFVFRWPGAYMPVRVYAEPVGELQANTVAAMQLWANAFRCGELSLVTVTDSTQADIIVRNPLTLPLAATAVVMAADSVGACRGVTQFDTASTALSGPMRAFVAPVSADPVAVAGCYHFVTAHELGHALGLLSHSPDTGDLMFPLPRHRVLTANDRVTIQMLYHATPTIGPPPRQ
jgi:predicted Zn-dependent protease